MWLLKALTGKVLPMSKYFKFQMDRIKSIEKMGRDQDISKQAIDFIRDTAKFGYSYNFEWTGRPIIQFPQDIVAMQELIWKVKPDLIIETGIAHGGSLVMSASILALLDMCVAIESGSTMDPKESHRKVLGVDIDIRAHNRKAIEAHPMSTRIQMIEGSSIEPQIIKQVHDIAKEYEKVMVLLDSNHTHAHVHAELEAYAPLTSIGSYCVVFDTIVEHMPDEMFDDRPWGKGDNPKTAVWEYIKLHTEFEIDKSIQDKLLITVAQDGYLKRISDE